MCRKIQLRSDGQRASQFVRKQGHEFFFATIRSRQPIGPLPLRTNRFTFRQSCVTIANDRAFLFASSSGVTTAWHQKRVPSLRSCQRLKTTRPSASDVFQFMLRLARKVIFGREDREKCIPDDFIGLVSEDAFRPRVPTKYLAFQIHQVDRILLCIIASKLKRSSISSRSRVYRQFASYFQPFRTSNGVRLPYTKSRGGGWAGWLRDCQFSNLAVG